MILTLWPKSCPIERAEVVLKLLKAPIKIFRGRGVEFFAQFLGHYRETSRSFDGHAYNSPTCDKCQLSIWALFQKARPKFLLTDYSCVLNTSHTVLGDMPDFYQKLVCITRHVIQFYQRPGWNTEHTNSLVMWQWHHFCFEVTREGLRPGWNCRHGKLFTQRPGWNKLDLKENLMCLES